MSLQKVFGWHPDMQTPASFLTPHQEEDHALKHLNLDQLAAVLCFIL